MDDIVIVVLYAFSFVYFARGRKALKKAETPFQRIEAILVLLIAQMPLLGHHAAIIAYRYVVEHS